MEEPTFNRHSAVTRSSCLCCSCAHCVEFCNVAWFVSPLEGIGLNPAAVRVKETWFGCWQIWNLSKSLGSCKLQFAYTFMVTLMLRVNKWGRIQVPVPLEFPIWNMLKFHGPYSCSLIHENKWVVTDWDSMEQISCVLYIFMFSVKAWSKQASKWISHQFFALKLAGNSLACLLALI